MEDIFIFELDGDLTAQFLKWYDAGKPNYIMYKDHTRQEEAAHGWTIGQYMLDEYYDCEVERIEGESRRWYRCVDIILDFKERYFSFSYNEGLTELQENEYWDIDSSIAEVWPHKKAVIITEWTTEKI